MGRFNEYPLDSDGELCCAFYRLLITPLTAFSVCEGVRLQTPNGITQIPHSYEWSTPVGLRLPLSPALPLSRALRNDLFSEHER